MATVMRAEATKLGQALLQHHHAVTTRIPPQVGKKLIVARYTIPYSRLCQEAGTAHILRMVGSFLAEVAEWCSENGYPPLNALAVNAQTGLPGEGYDGAGGFTITDWPTEVEQCIRFPGYPQTFA